MNKLPFFRKSLLVVPFILFSQFATTDALARPEYVVPTGASSCTDCHTSIAGSASNVKPQALAAFTAAGLTGLTNMIHGCAAGTTLNPTTFQCVASVTPPPPPAPVVKWTSVSGQLGTGADGTKKTDVFTVSCPTGTAKLAVKVKDNPKVLAPKVSIQASKGGASSTLSVDPIDGDTLFSPKVTLAKGVGDYTVNVNKSASTVKVAELYTARFACLNANGASKTMATAPLLTQDQ